MLLSFPNGDGVPLLKHFVYGYQGLERLDFVGLDWLHFHGAPERLTRLKVPCVDDAIPHVFPLWSCFFDIGSFGNDHSQALLGPGEVDVSRHGERDGESENRGEVGEVR